MNHDTRIPDRKYHEPAAPPQVRHPSLQRAFSGASCLVTAALTFGSATISQTLAPGLTGGVVFTADEYGATISQIDLKSGKVTTVPATVEPHNVQISPDGSLLLAVGIAPDHEAQSGY